MLNNLTGKQRTWAVVAAAWMLLVLFVSAPWEHSGYGESGNWKGFFIFGILPIACVLAALWVRRGYRLEREAEAKAVAEEVKAAVDARATATCPGCKHQVRRNSLEQVKFNCTRCNTTFYRCRSCGAVTPESPVAGR